MGQAAAPSYTGNSQGAENFISPPCCLPAHHFPLFQPANLPPPCSHMYPLHHWREWQGGSNRGSCLPTFVHSHFLKPIHLLLITCLFLPHLHGDPIAKQAHQGKPQLLSVAALSLTRLQKKDARGSRHFGPPSSTAFQAHQSCEISTESL